MAAQVRGHYAPAELIPQKIPAKKEKIPFTFDKSCVKLYRLAECHSPGAQLTDRNSAATGRLL